MAPMGRTSIYGLEQVIYHQRLLRTSSIAHVGYWSPYGQAPGVSANGIQSSIVLYSEPVIETL